jgi:hypothetical protein
MRIFFSSKNYVFTRGHRMTCYGMFDGSAYRPSITNKAILLRVVFSVEVYVDKLDLNNHGLMSVYITRSIV